MITLASCHVILHQLRALKRRSCAALRTLEARALEGLYVIFRDAATLRFACKCSSVYSTKSLNYHEGENSSYVHRSTVILTAAAAAAA